MNSLDFGFTDRGLLGPSMASSPFAKALLTSALGNRPFGRDDLNGGPQLG
jgi:hypothetical protein